MDKLYLTNWTDKQDKRVLQIVNDILVDVEEKDAAFVNSYKAASTIASIEIRFSFYPEDYV